MKPKVTIEKYYGEHSVTLKIGVQKFHLEAIRLKKDANFIAKQLRKALKGISNEKSY